MDFYCFRVDKQVKDVFSERLNYWLQSDETLICILLRPSLSRHDNNIPVCVCVCVCVCMPTGWCVEAAPSVFRQKGEMVQSRQCFPTH